jgi:hypothetical protein
MQQEPLNAVAAGERLREALALTTELLEIARCRLSLARLHGRIDGRARGAELTWLRPSPSFASSAPPSGRSVRRLSSVGLAEDAAKNETSAVGEHVFQLAERYLSRGAKTPVPSSWTSVDGLGH